MKFITYFDYLGFGDFIRNNDLEYQRKIMGNIFRDIESALAKGKLIDAKHGVIADLSQSRVNCINFSDTVVFWTNDISSESVEELLHITHVFNWQANLYFFPVRGTMTMGELERVEFDQKSGLGGSYNINSVFGKGLVKAHEIAESQKWAGTLLDENVETFINDNLENNEDVLATYTKSFEVPFKAGDKEMRVFNLIKGELNDIAFNNYKEGIERNFGEHNKGMEHPSVKEKLANTIDFLESYRNHKPS
jgi:hypothetical protein